MATPAATAALMLRVEPNWAIDTVRAAPAVASGVMPLLPEDQQARSTVDLIGVVVATAC